MPALVTTQSIHPDLLPVVLQKFQKTLKLATRLGSPPPTIDVGGEYWTRKVVGGVRMIIERHLDVAVSCEPPRYAGWALKARLERADAGVIVQCVPGVVDLPERYRAHDGSCDHCHKRRRRLDTFVLQHDDGTWKCVGRNCVADFLGHNINFLAYFKTLDACAVDPDGDGHGRVEPSEYTIDAVKVIALLIRRDGFLSRAAAQIGNRTPTSSDVATVLSPPVGPGEAAAAARAFSREAWAAIKADANADQFARDVVAFWRDYNVRSDFDHNCRALLSADFLLYKHLGIACAAVNGYFRHLGQQSERARIAKASANSQYVGEVGARIELTLTVIKVFSFDTDFGRCHINKFIDGAGNVFVWKSSTRCREGDVEIGKATIKAHKEYGGVKETHIARFSLIPAKADAGQCPPSI